MVFFTCNACGESLKKAQVDKHVSICRGCEVLSCIDCGKDFWGNDYKNHVQCISEDQKYGGRGYEAKANKGDVKQQQWLQKIQMAQSKPGVSASLQRVLEQVATYNNVPRKKSKFENWMKNSLKISNCSLHQQVWDILSADSEPLHKNPASTEAVSTVPDIDSCERKKLNKLDQKDMQRQNNGLTIPQDCISDKKQDQNEDKGLDQQDPTVQRKRKHKEEQNTKGKKAKNQPDDSNQEPDKTEQKAPNGKFNWKGNIKALLRDAPDQELSIKRLRKKVLSAFYSFTAEDCNKSEEMVLALFNKKINNNPKFRVLKDRVKLIK